MEINVIEITDIQLAWSIIQEVGKKHQGWVIDKLRGLTYHHDSTQEQRDAQQVISNMLCEYSLNLANQLVKDKYDDLKPHTKQKVTLVK